MNERLRKIIELKTGGVQTEFCALMGWSPQYLAKLLKGTNFGIVPVVAIVTKFPDLNARWFLTGEGEMLDDEAVDLYRSAVRSHVDKVFELEKYIPVMSPSELRAFEDVLFGHGSPDFSPEILRDWDLRLSQRNETLCARVRNAKLKSDLSCNLKEARK